jgi:hypothetical protein
LTFNQLPNKRLSRDAARPMRAGHVSTYAGRPVLTRMTINARLISKILTSLAIMPDYATMVAAGVRDRQDSGPVFLTASANRYRYKHRGRLQVVLLTLRHSTLEVTA